METAEETAISEVEEFQPYAQHFDNAAEPVGFAAPEALRVEGTAAAAAVSTAASVFPKKRGADKEEAWTDVEKDQFTDEASNKIFTIPNLISLGRLLFIPIFLTLLLDGKSIMAAFVFAFAASTDFLDGYVARATGQVSKLGQLLDPTVDRALMISGAIGLILVKRLPIWIVVVIIARDLYLFFGGAYLMKKYKSRVPVILAGKICTTILYVGLALLLINWPLVPGLGITTWTWLPGFTATQASIGIWFVYAGLILGVFTTAYYIKKAYDGKKRYLAAQAQRG